MRIGGADHWCTGPPGPGTPIAWDSDHADGLVAWWPGWEGGGVRFYEEVLTGNHAKNTGTAPQLVASDEGFPGVTHSVASGAGGFSDAFAFGQSNSLESATWTLCIRMMLTAKSAFGGPISYRFTDTARRAWAFLSNEGTLGAFTPVLQVYNAAGTQLNQWKSGTTLTLPFARPVQFVWTWDGTNAKLWTDGFAETVTTVGTGGTPSAGGYLGWCFNPAVGAIYDVRFYNRARPELGPELADPSTRWKIFESPRITRAGGPAKPATAIPWHLFFNRAV